MIRRGKGLHPPTPGKGRRRYGAALHAGIAAALLAGLVGSGDLSSSAPPVKNQGASETCWAHSASTLKYTALKAAGHTPAFVSSPLYFAQCVYAHDRAAATPVGQPFSGPPGLPDTGADLDDAAEVFAKYGDIPMQAPQQSGDTDVPATSDATGAQYPLPEATPQELAEGMSEPFGGEYAIACDANAPRIVAAAIDAKVPVWIGCLVGSAFENLQPGQVAGPTPANDTTAGGHAMAVLGYRTSASGALEFKLRNSWGDEWCENGDGWVSAEFIATAWSLLPFAIKAAA